MPALVDVEEEPDSWQPSVLLESFDDLPVGIGELPEGIRDELTRHFSTSALDTDWENQEDSFELRTFVLLRDRDGRRDLVRLAGSLKSDGELTVEGMERLATFRAPGRDLPAASVAFPRRTRVPLMELRWEKLSRSNQSAWYEALEDFDVRTEDLVLRIAGLSFYSRHKLLEVLERERGHYRRSYALVTTGDDGPEIRPMNGKSGLIHAVNAMADELQLNASTADDYVRFFCWAVHGEEGPFPVPSTFREIAFEDAPTTEQRQALREMDFSMGTVSDEEAERLGYPKTATPVIRRQARIAHGSAVFDAWFSINASGIIEMLHDEARIADLPIHNEHYGRDELFVLRKWTELRGARPHVRHYLQELLGEDEAGEGVGIGETDLEHLSPQLFTERLSHTAKISRVKVTEPLILGVESARRDKNAH